MHNETFIPTISLQRLTSSVFCTALLILIIMFPSRAEAQTPGMNPQDKTINAQTQLEVIDSVSQALNQVYVFPDVAKKMEKYLRDQFKNKKYKDLTSLDKFTQKLTEDLQEISHDKHLWVRFASDEMLARFRGDTLTDEAKQLELEERRRDNFCFKEVKILEGNVGYVDFRCFSDAIDAGPTAIASMNFLAYTDAIIFDLRQNGGGSPSMIQLITSYFFPEPVHLNSFYVRKSDSTQQFWTQACVQGPRMTNVDLYVLTSSYIAAGKHIKINIGHSRTLN
ncbi:MAG: S41 family peptidase, partial [candidate division Zixibacteria bacterium]|nr:S41 family peptidase [candidate division Zixibacteria bacterium]